MACAYWSEKYLSPKSMIFARYFAASAKSFSSSFFRFQV